LHLYLVTNSTYDVVVIGAGISGLAAARVLAASGMQVAVIEARDRIGGRILTQYHENRPFELGAEFVHGKPSELWDLIHESGLETYELDGSQFCWRNQVLSECDRDLEDDFNLIDALKSWEPKDISFKEYIEQTDASEESRQRVIGYVEGFNAADSRIIGVASLGKQQAAEDAIEGDRLFRLRDGYARLPEFLEAQIRKANGQVFLSIRAERVIWTPGMVTVECSTPGGSLKFRARSAVITLPLGVLQSGSVQFLPEPTETRLAIDEMRMGNAWRTVLLFRDRFWANLEGQAGKLSELSFLYSFGTNPPAWWTPAPEKTPALTAWAGGPRADLLSKQTAVELKPFLCQTLSQIFATEAESLEGQLVDGFHHDWQLDPFSLGAYSYVPAGALDASQRISEPVHQTLFFAGEHTDVTGHWGTVHGALRSALRAANQLLASQ
jgi:monoamine oxidase